MYLGKLEREDLFDDLIFEALCHAIDESLDDRCKHINIDIDLDSVVYVRYDAAMSLGITPSGRPTADELMNDLGMKLETVSISTST